MQHFYLAGLLLYWIPRGGNNINTTWKKRRPDLRTLLASAKHAKNTDIQLTVWANPAFPKSGHASGDALAIRKPIKTPPANRLPPPRTSPPPPPAAADSARSPERGHGRRDQPGGVRAGPQRLHLRAPPPAERTPERPPRPAALPTRAAARHSPVRSPEPRSSVPGDGHETALGEEAAGQAPHVLPVPRQGAAKPVRAALARHGGRPPRSPDTATAAATGNLQAPRRKRCYWARRRGAARLHVPAGIAPQSGGRTAALPSRGTLGAVVSAGDGGLQALGGRNEISKSRDSWALRWLAGWLLRYRLRCLGRLNGCRGVRWEEGAAASREAGSAPVCGAPRFCRRGRWCCDLCASPAPDALSLLGTGFYRPEGTGVLPACLAGGTTISQAPPSNCLAASAIEKLSLYATAGEELLKALVKATRICQG